MSAIVTRSRDRASRQRRRHLRTQEQSENDQPIVDGACIDLTNDDSSQDAPVVIDLTSPMRVNELPIVIIDSLNDNENHNRRRTRRLSDDVIELPPVPFTIRDDNPPSSSSPLSANVTSPKRPNILCPVCLDEAHIIKRSGRKIMSTVCGHIFCSTCIEGAISIQKKCPNCRKNITMAKVHEIFI